jgi:hypothetical protein
MKTLLLTLSLAVTLASGAFAQGYQFQDQYGRNQGSMRYNQFNQGWQYQDQYGRNQGTATWNQFNNSWQYKDQYGRNLGSSHRSPW